MNLADILNNEEIIIEKLNDIHKNSVHFFLKLWYEEDRIKLEQVKEFIMRNDKYRMAYSMEGRFPLATKTYLLF